MKFPDDYRFGVSTETMRQERDDHLPIIRLGCYVPTVKEVFDTAPQKLYEILDFWMWESPTLLIPSDDQIKEVISVIEERPDSDACEKALNACYRYVGGSKG